MRLAALISFGSILEIVFEIIFESGSIAASDADADDNDLRRRKEANKRHRLSIRLKFLDRTRVLGQVVLFDSLVMVGGEGRNGG